jgi:hypothetical protein
MPPVPPDDKPAPTPDASLDPREPATGRQSPQSRVPPIAEANERLQEYARRGAPPGPGYPAAAEDGAPEPILTLELDGLTHGEITRALLDAVSEKCGTSVESLFDVEKTPPAMRVAIEEAVGTFTRLAVVWQREEESRLLVAVTKTAVLGKCEGDRGRSSEVLTFPRPSPPEPPAPKAAAATRRLGSPVPPPARPPQAPLAPGVGRPGLSRRGAPAGPVRPRS